MSNIPQLLLAAGSSTRMKQPKQLLSWGNKTLIEHQITTLLKTDQEVIVVLGAYADKILPIIKELPITIFINNNWTNGMGNSIAFGIKMISEIFFNVDGVLISLVDQPLINTKHLKRMLNSFQPSKKQIIMSRSSIGWDGVPVLFDSYYFKILQTLKGEQGAKRIFNKEINKIKYIDAGDLLIDIDTPDVYEKMIIKKNK